MTRARAMVITRPGHMELQEFPLPPVGEEDGILKVELCGVCGSDPGIFRGKASRAPRPYPLIPGHEIVGRIHALGKKARRRHGLKEGDRVVVEYAFGCGRCRACLAGRYTLCERFFTYGSMVSCAEPPHLYGGYADYLYLHPNAKLHRLPDEVPPEVGVLVSAVLGNGLRWLTRIGNAAPGRAAAIVGPGLQGLAGVVAAREAGCAPILVVGTSRDARRLELARRLGAEITVNVEQQDPVEVLAQATGGRLAQVVMDVSASPAGAATALALAGTGACLVLPGLYGPQTQVPLLLDQVVVKELRLLGAYSHDFESVEAALAVARSGRYPLEELISHRFPLERAEEAVRLVGGEAPGELPLKVLIDLAL